MAARNRFLWSVVSTATLALLLSTPARSAGQKAPDVDPQAMKSIERMSEFLAAAKQFSVTADISYDIVQEWGQKIEFGETRVLTVRRPDLFRVDTTDRDGSKNGVVFDGKAVEAFDLQAKLYAVANKPGSLDDAISYFVDQLGMRLPMAVIIQGRMPQMAKEWAQDVDYVDQSTIEGVPCDHVAMHGEWEDVQLWIARGDKPLLHRMVITYTRAEGKPQFSANFENWNLSPDVPDSFFAFTPPQGFAQIPFKARTSGLQAGATKAQGGQP